MAKKKTNLYEHYLGDLPSSKLMKMKWNPLEESEPVNEAKATFSWNELNSTFLGMGMNTRRIADIRKALKNATGK